MQANNSYCCLPNGHIAIEIKHNQVVVKKQNKGDEGSKQFTSNFPSATEALQPGFGAAKHFIQSSRDGKEDVGNANHTYIQKFCCSNLTKIDFFLSILLCHMTSRFFSLLGSSITLCMVTLE